MTFYDDEFDEDYDDRYSRTATESEAHAEWHWNAGVPMGTPGCPQDACHGEDDYEEEAPVVICATCGRADWDGYRNDAAGERCADPCHPRAEFVPEPTVFDNDDVPF